MKSVRKPVWVTQENMAPPEHRRKENATTAKENAPNRPFPRRNFRPMGVTNCAEDGSVDNDGASDEN